MLARSSTSFRPPRFRRIRLSLFLLPLACLLLPNAVRAQVTFNGVKGQQSVNFGSQAIGSRSATISLPFTIASDVSTTVGSIGVLTTGIAGKDFIQETGSTSCGATTYAAATDCVIDVTFDPLAAGLRLGAAVFYAGAGKTSAVLAMVPLYGIGIGPELAFGPGGAETSVGHKFISPAGVAVDAAGDVFVTDLDYQEVFKVTPNGTQTTVGGGFEVPEAVAVDGAGNLYVADSEAAEVFKVTPGGVQTTVGTGFDYPNGIAVDGAGNVYVTDPFIDEVIKITPGGTQSTVGGGYNTPAGVAVDAAGNVYVADTYNQEVFKVTPGGTQTTVGTNLVSPAAVAVDAARDVYIIDDGTNALYEVTPGGTQTTVTSDLDVPDGVAVDGSGNLYVANSYDEHALKIDRADAPSLHFDSTHIGSTSKDSPRTVKVENIGNAPIKFSALSYPANFPEAAAGDNCTTSTSLDSASTCALTIDFKPVTSLGTKSSAALTGAVKFTTNTLNVPKTTKDVDVSGTETAK
jgi:sugar lactone lactonase YvrE